MPTKAPRICSCGHSVASGAMCACERQRHAERNARHDQRRLPARERGYDSRWDKARATHLVSHPTCEWILDGAPCGKPASVVDHQIPHRGNQKLFWNKANWKSLCATCHSSRKQSQERRGYDAQRRATPFDIRRSRIPVTIVCGPPGSGKSTYVRKRAGARDLVIDIAEIKARLSGRPVHDPASEYTGAALDERNRILRSLAADFEHERAWFIIAAPHANEREAWQEKLGAEEIVLLDVDFDECRRRIRADPARIGQQARMEVLVADWWQHFTRKPEKVPA